MSYHFRRGSSPLRTAVQVRGHRHGVRALEYLNGDGQFVSARRDAYNYFVHPMGAGPYTFRLTDTHGSIAVERDVPHRPSREVRGTAQFPACQP
jgi:expansin (peptidoglycan-binding protein)